MCSAHLRPALPSRPVRCPVLGGFLQGGSQVQAEVLEQVAFPPAVGGTTSSSSSDTVQQRFSSTKSISSDQYFESGNQVEKSLF